VSLWIDEVIGDLVLVPGEEVDAEHRLRIVRDQHETTAFVAQEPAALLLPRDNGERALRALPLSTLPAALAQLVGLAPRPRAQPRRVPAAELATALARPTEQDLLPTPLTHWRAEREPKALEVLDTGEGLFIVRAEGGDAVLHPTTATRVFRGLVRLVRG
jgi:hypothetical protein